MTRILFLGDLAATGFGSVTMDLGRALLALGHDVRFISQNELGDLPEPFASRTFIVNDPDGWANMREAGVIGLLDGSLWEDKWAPEAAIQLGDYFAVRELVLASASTRAAYASIPVVHYVPVEGIDLPPTWKEMWDIVHPIAMSEFGADQIEKVTGTRPPMVYHGVDTEQFRPVSSTKPLWMHGKDGQTKALRSKADCKRFFGASPDTMWLFRADRHMPRKNYNAMLRAIAPVLASHRNTFMVVHCKSFDEGGYLPDTIAKYPPFVASRMVNSGFHDLYGGASREVLTALYNAADVYLSTSAEGFGLTMAEAVACGVPTVGIDYGPTPEVIGPAGLLAPIARLVDNTYDHFWALPDERKYGPLVASLLDDDVLRKRLGRAGPEHVRANFSWDRAALQFSAAISDKLTERAAA